MEYSQDMIKSIVAMVIDELQFKVNPISIKPHEKKLLILVSGGKFGASEALEQIKILHSEGYAMKALYTFAGRNVLGHEWLCKSIPDIEIISPDFNVSPITLLKEIDAIVIPVLTFNTAAKICSGIADNMVLSVLLYALLQGKPIIAAGDACNPNNSHITGGKIKSPLYLNRLYDNIKTLRQYGMTIVDASDIRKTVHEVFTKNRDCGEFVNESCITIKSNTNSGGDDIYTDRILSASIVSQYKSNPLVISKNTIVTQAAKDVADKRGISIIMEGWL